ncbi:uncharacterized protein [Dasypus novemcinctus]|uniref:uncharacterized protein n=1 Tax=Dasypus novemcinctus TaxID=9361 RepID=UPI00265E68E2|nr:uncharacterized protein LOC101428729 [Dasypus novemcinctus]
MPHFTKWNAAHMSKSLTAYDNARVPCERKEKKKQENLPEDQQLTLSQVLQKAKGAQSTEDKTKETGEDKSLEEGPPLSKAEPRKDSKDWKLPIPPGTVYPPLVSSSMSATKAGGRSWELSPRIAKSFRIRDGPFWHLMDTKLEKRLAGRKERRSRFGDIDAHKCYQFGQIFSPFQALATMEMRRTVFPQDLPTSPQMQRISASHNTNGTLQDLSLSSSGFDLGKDDNSREKEKPVSHIKTPLFPPIVRATKSNDMK